MDGKKSHDFAKPQYSYGAIERALAGIFGLQTASERGRLRAHLKHLRRVGFGTGAGKGARLDYSLAEGSQWLLAMLASEIDVPPAISVPVIKKAWPQIQRWFERSIDNEALGGNPVWLTMRPEPMTGWAAGPKWIGFFRWTDSRSKQPYGLLNAAYDDEWLCTRNLSRVMFKFVETLESEGGLSGNS